MTFWPSGLAPGGASASRPMTPRTPLRSRNEARTRCAQPCAIVAGKTSSHGCIHLTDRSVPESITSAQRSFGLFRLYPQRARPGGELRRLLDFAFGRRVWRERMAADRISELHSGREVEGIRYRHGWSALDQ